MRAEPLGACSGLRLETPTRGASGTSVSRGRLIDSVRLRFRLPTPQRNRWRQDRIRHDEDSERQNCSCGPDALGEVEECPQGSAMRKQGLPRRRR